MGEELALTASNIRYLLVIRQLDKLNCGVRCTDIAAELGLTKPTVHSMLKKLTELGLVFHALGGRVYLTEAGSECAQAYDACHSTAVSMFKVVLALSEREAIAAAYSLLAEIPAKRLDELAARLALLLEGFRVLSFVF